MSYSDKVILVLLPHPSYLLSYRPLRPLLTLHFCVDYRLPHDWSKATGCAQLLMTQLIGYCFRLLVTAIYLLLLV